MTSGDDPTPVAVICGSGRLPVEVVTAARASGRKVVAIAIKGEADPAIAEHDPAYLGWGQIGKLADLLKRESCRDVVMIGGVTRRPEIREIVGDLGTMRRLPRIVAALVGGDDSLLTRIIRLFEDEGFRIIGAHEIAPELLAGEGVIAGPRPSAEAMADLELARRAVIELGRLDIGQGAVAIAGRIVAVEGAEGTDAMLRRCAELRQIGRVKGKGGVLVKCAKPGQDLRIDLPAIGPATVELAAAAGLAGVAVEAGRVLIAERARTLQLAGSSKVFLWGMPTLPQAPTLSSSQPGDA
ncbi:LpxI family protein [Stappia indica]|uniref:LpxI family protein n=1 Tax=Stappia indica TaxID=538381 RepID=UPI001CD19B55|nr:UDP-2,3-diacylglucosamine diphosphatase LpxI [Stappia indica]MCA1297123.1 UDP-2,3-diacylglucosamine diphosphatase LpxI [Stappia indica]